MQLTRNRLLLIFLGEPLHRNLWGYLRKRAHSRALTDDVMQATAERLLRLPVNYPFPETPVPFIYKIADNLLIDQSRLGFRKNECLFSEIDDSVLNVALEEHVTYLHPEHVREVQDELAHVLGAAQHLTDQQHACFVLRKVYGYSQKEIASILGVAEGTVESHLHNAVLALSKRLGQDMRAAYKRVS